MTTFIHGGMMFPEHLVKRLPCHETVTHLHVHNEYHDADRLDVRSLFSGANVRGLVNNEYVPCNLSQIPHRMYNRDIRIDKALLMVSPPDHNGEVSLGTSVDVALAAMVSARTKIAQVNSCVPRTMGTAVKLREFDRVIEHDQPMPEVHEKPVDQVQQRIGELVANEIPDGATIQLGIGAIASSVATCLTDHKCIRVHSEMITDAVVDLELYGDVKGVISTSFAIGSNNLLEAVDENDRYRFLSTESINDFLSITSKPRFQSINNITEADLYGNTNCDSIGGKFYSGIGGQMDFALASQYSAGGQSFLCMKSTTSSGKSRINTELTGRATIPMHMVDNIVTEYGVAKLAGKSLSERRAAMVAIAHPTYREQLSRN